MSDWQKVLKDESISTLEELRSYVAERFGEEVAEREIDVAALQPAFDNFQMRITRESLSQIREVGDANWNQFIPTVQELEIVDGVIDSLDEDGDSPVPNITHRYPDRALFLVSPVCASYCRFCTRRRKVGDPEKISLKEYESAFQYLAAHPEIRDVILSGGDPMMLSDSRLEYILQRLRAIPHIEIIRLGSRITSHLPERVTPEFCEMVQKYHPIFMNTHFNHPSELTPASVAALDRLSRAGVSLGCQTVLLKGVNDDPKVMMKLMHELLKARVRPYYIYMADQVAGGEHFRTTVQKGLEIMQALRGWTSGLAVPQFVIDAPGGGGKVPLLPEYVEEITDDEVVFRNYEGKRFSYKQPRMVVPDAAPGVAAEADDVVPIAVGKTVKKSRAARQRKSMNG
ncbi:MAG: KamA family radical SAM protein [Gemmatimonadaceae bacterium]|nr:KamA family radical SAM protein [Gemmatimonadaceae bacterium]NUS47070.1 KamA family radical SAM protein [Gemmatimonadaceae bacterium]